MDFHRTLRGITNIFKGKTAKLRHNTRRKDFSNPVLFLGIKFSSECKSRTNNEILPLDKNQVLKHIVRVMVVIRFIQTDSLAMTKTLQKHILWYRASFHHADNLDDGVVKFRAAIIRRCR